MWSVLLEYTEFVRLNAISKTDTDHNHKICMLSVERLTMIMKETEKTNYLKI